MSSRRTLEQALPITPWQQALRGLRALQTTSLCGRWGGVSKNRHEYAHAESGERRGEGGAFRGFRLPAFAKLPGPRGWGGGRGRS